MSVMRFLKSHVLQPVLPRAMRPLTPLERQVKALRDLSVFPSVPCDPPVASIDFNVLRICWVIPDFQAGAGGHMTIFRIAHALEQFGHRVQFLIRNPSVHTSGEQARETINQYFQPFKGRVDFLSPELAGLQGDALIATDRYTCFPIEAMNGFVRKFYFVQDYEPSFYPAGTEAFISEQTYWFDFDCLCAGDWLHKLMSERYGRWSVSWPLAPDHTIYRPDEAETRSTRRIAFYARYATPRRAVELGMMALDELAERGVDFEVDFFGQRLGDLSVSYPYRDHGLLTPADLSHLYRSAAVGMVFSATNHSLVNKEMMACGLPVLDLDIEPVRAIFPKETMFFAKPSPNAIADRLETLLGDSSERQRVGTAAQAFVADLSWDKSARIVEEAIKQRLTNAIAKQTR